MAGATAVWPGRSYPELALGDIVWGMPSQGRQGQKRLPLCSFVTAEGLHKKVLGTYTCYIRDIYQIKTTESFSFAAIDQTVLGICVNLSIIPAFAGKPRCRNTPAFLLVACPSLSAKPWKVFPVLLRVPDADQQLTPINSLPVRRGQARKTSRGCVLGRQGPLQFHGSPGHIVEGSSHGQLQCNVGWGSSY